MVTIKIKEKFNLSQLMEWIMENNIRYEQYIPKHVIGLRHIAVDGFGDIRIQGFIRTDDIFEIEIEEEITEDTKFDRLIAIESSDEEIFRNRSINSLVNGDTKEFHAYIDGEFKLIWRDGKLAD